MVNHGADAMRTFKRLTRLDHINTHTHTHTHAYTHIHTHTQLTDNTCH